MVACSFTDECAVAVPAERLWKAMSVKSSLLPKACAGYIDSVEVEGDGGVGSVTTVKFINPGRSSFEHFLFRPCTLLHADRRYLVVRFVML